MTLDSKQSLEDLVYYRKQIQLCPKCAKQNVKFSENSVEILHVGLKLVGSKWLRF